MKKNEINKLINVCKEKQGEYVSAGHPRTSWATTYSNDFIEASANLYLIFFFQGLNPLINLSEIFIKNGIKSCRGSAMNYSRVEYLYENHIKPLIAFKSDGHKKCDYCNRKAKDLVLHVSHKHPERWGEFFLWYGNKVRFYMGDKERCECCGNFVNNYELHKTKCLLI